MSEDERAWKDLTCWGEIKEFLSFRWQGALHCVALISPCPEVTINWIPGLAKGTGPQFFKISSRELPLQVVDIKALISNAGRIPRPGLKGMIVFDTSSGHLDPELQHR